MILRDSVHGLVSFEATAYQIVPRLLETAEFQRLRRIRQLGLTSFAYPGADHTRFAHAIGAAFVMTRLIDRLRDIDHVLPLAHRVTETTAQEAVVAALLHDIGHGPFSHLLEAAIPHGPSHEDWSERIIMDPDTEVHQVLAREDRGLAERVVKLIRGQHALSYLAHAVSGTFDVDRCDYLLRDAHSTGVSYGRFDLDWLLRSLCFDTTVYDSDPNSPAPPLAVDGPRGLPAIESFLLARLFMFQQVYFHKASRASEWALSRILGHAQRLLLDGHNLPGLPDGACDLLRDGETYVSAYLSLDDASLWQAISAWQHARDPLLADLCRRLYHRKLFKTHELFFPDDSDEKYAEAERIARDLARQHGLDPNLYVGLDSARLIPFDETKDSLRVLFPDGSSHAPADVSFILGRLRGEQFVRRRLIVPVEIRAQLRKTLGATWPGSHRSKR